MTYTGPDEYPIADIPETPWWSENFASMWYSPTDNISLWYSIGRWHSELSIWREIIMIRLPDSRILYHRSYGRASGPTWVGGGLSRYDMIEPGRRVHLSMDGPFAESSYQDLAAIGIRSQPHKRVKIDLMFEASQPMWNMRGDSYEAATVAGAIHIDHIGKSNGTIEFDGHTYRFDDGYVARDHSRGPREVSHYGGHSWINGSFPGGRAFYFYAMNSEGSNSIGMSNAAIAQDGRLYNATVLQTEFATSMDDAGKTHQVILESELGEMVVDIVEVFGTFPSGFVLPFDSYPGHSPNDWVAFVMDEPVRLRWNGEEAYGWSERGFANMARYGK